MFVNLESLMVSSSQRRETSQKGQITDGEGSGIVINSVRYELESKALGFNSHVMGRPFKLSVTLFFHL